MNLKCPNCNLINFANAEKCARCGHFFSETNFSPNQKVIVLKPQDNVVVKIIKRAVICLGVCLLTILGFYLSLIYTAQPLSAVEKQKVQAAIAVLENRGFRREAFYLKNFTVFRTGDNWFNASTTKEAAYAATNFPFEVIALYPGFFDVPQDDSERAMILLHEAQHLQGKDEKSAYEYVWKNRAQLGWTQEKYNDSLIWRNVRKQTKEYVPYLFACDFNDYGDCTK